MIEKMKKLTLLLYHRDKEEFLEKLRELGVVHVEEDPAARSESLEEVRSEKQALRRVVVEVKRLKAQTKEVPPARDDHDVQWILEQFDSLSARKDSAGQQVAALHKDIAMLEPWGEFDPDMLTALADAGLNARFFECSAKQFDRLELNDVYHAVVSREKGTVRFVVFEREERLAIEAEEAIVPRSSLSELYGKLEEAESEQQTASNGLVKLIAYQIGRAHV